MVELVGNIPDDAVLQAQLDILYGQTPDITIKAHELPEESEPTVEKSGTLAEPVFNIGIPQAMGAVAAREYAKQAETARDAAILAGETAKEELNGIVASADDALDQKIAETGTLLDEKVATAAQRASEAASSAVAAAQKATAAEQAMQGAQAAQAQAEQSAQEAADSAASINPSVYMQKSVYDPGNEQQPLLPRNGDGSNVTASFTEAEQDADIQTGEELTVLFGKIKKRFSAMLAAIADRYTKTEAEARFMPNPSLLDNSDFTNPVNQRGVSGTISTAGYFIDRWKLVSGTVQITAEGLVLNGTISQILENAAGTDVTASASAGTASYDNSTKTFTLTATGQTITWAKLEKGSVSTPYVPKGYGAELLACQRYYVPIGENTKFFGGIGTAGNVAFVGMILPVQMRVTPSFTSDLNVVLRTVQGEQNIHGPVISKMTENNLAFTVTLNSGTTKSTPCAGYFYNERGLSADL